MCRMERGSESRREACGESGLAAGRDWIVESESGGRERFLCWERL